MPKVRTDYVTNSSSSCFIVAGYSDLTVEKTKEILEILFAAHDRIEGTSTKLDEVCFISDTKDKDEINVLFSKQSWSGDDYISKCLAHDIEFCFRCPNHDNDVYKCNAPEDEKKYKTYTQLVQEGRLAIFGHPNAIPCKLHVAICDYLSASHLHLG